MGRKKKKLPKKYICLGTVDISPEEIAKQHGLSPKRCIFVPYGDSAFGLRTHWSQVIIRPQEESHGEQK